MNEVNIIATKYLRQSIMLTLLLYALGYAFSHLLEIWGIMNSSILNIPLMVAALFTLITSAAVGMLWQWVATAHKDMLTTFYTATSGFRMLLALLVMTVVYFIVGREAMLPYAFTFIFFYFVSVGHHSIYFARNNKF